MTKTLYQFTKKSKLIVCSCGARYSEVLKRCPGCGLVNESVEEIKNWKEI